MPVKGYVFPDIYFGDNDLAVFGRFQFRLVIIIKSNLLCACDLVFRTQLTGQYIGCPFGDFRFIFTPEVTVYFWNIDARVSFTPLISIEEPAEVILG